MLGRLSSKAKKVCGEASVINLRISCFVFSFKLKNETNLTQFVIIYSSETR